MRIRRVVSVVLIAVSFAAVGKTDAQPHLVRDINTTRIDPGNAIQAVEALGTSTAIFHGCEPGTGCEPWSSDGTPEGTRLLADTLLGASSPLCDRTIQAAGTRAYFQAADALGTGCALWVTDGRPDGTHPLTGEPGGSTPRYLAELAPIPDGTLFFTDSENKELWYTDGTSVGTQRLYAAGAEEILDLVFAEPGRVFTAHYTPGGVALTARDAPGWSARVLGSFDALSHLSSAPGGLAYFSGCRADTGCEPWVTDGTVAGTRLVADLVLGEVGSRPFSVGLLGDRVLLSATLPDIGRELFISDGTKDGTVMVADLEPGVGDSQPSDAIEVGELAFFRAHTTAEGQEVWITDGTKEGTRIARDVRPGPDGSGPFELQAFAGTAVFLADDGEGLAIWESDGSQAGTRRLNGVGAGQPTTLAASRDLLFFDTEDQLWRTDGTPAGSVSLTRLETGNASSLELLNSGLVASGPRVFFNATERTGDPRRLWVSDGTPEGTRKLAAVEKGESVAFRGGLVFQGCDEEAGCEPWWSDGTPEATHRLRDLVPGPDGSEPLWFTSVDDHVVFAATEPSLGRELWTTDGTPEGTRPYLDGVPGPTGSDPRGVAALADRLVFRACTDAQGCELWHSDGTPEKTEVVEINPGERGVPFASIVALDDAVVFTVCWANAFDLWRSDGTADGTDLLWRQSHDDTDDCLGPLMRVGAWVYFSATTPDTGRELWRSDGTSEGTTLVADVLPGLEGSFPGPVSGVAELVYFTADDDLGRSLWQSDGTAAGTSRVPGSTGSSRALRDTIPWDPTPIGGRVVFAQLPIIFPIRVLGGLWIVEPPAGASQLMADLQPGYFVNAGGTVFFEALEPIHGNELWALPGCPDDDSDGVCNESDRCPGDTRAVAALCDDRDACTVDTCEQLVGCRSDALDATRISSVLCLVRNAEAIMLELPQPVCAGRCQSRLARRLARIENLVRSGVAASAPPRCRRKLQRASLQARALARKVERLAKRGRVTPLDRGTRLRDQLLTMSDRSLLLRDGVCVSSEPASLPQPSRLH